MGQGFTAHGPCDARLQGPFEEGRKAGHTFSQPDLIIAATGQHHGLTVVSRDTSEFVNARVPVLNP
jgi:toxin FitB